MINKLIAIQSELKAPKGQFNKFGNYKYRNAEDILEAVKPLLKKYNCLLTLSDDIRLVGDRFYVMATATITDAETRKYEEVKAFAIEEATKKVMDASQITGTASSYARKYALNGLFCIDDTKDADSNEYKKQEKQEKKTAKELKEDIDKDAIINDGAVDYIVNLCKDAGSDPKAVCEYYKVSNFGAMTYKVYEQACHMLEVKLQKKKEK